MCSCEHQILCSIWTKHSLMSYTSLSALTSNLKGKYVGLPSLMNYHQYNHHMICLMKPLLVTLMITLLSNLKGVAFHNLTRLKRLHQMHLRNSKLCLLMSHLEGQHREEKYLLSLIMSTVISHHLKWCETLRVNVLGER